jgi:hypothetical protein
MSRAHPQLVSVKLEKLHPTQLTVGKEEVALKRREWEKLTKKSRAAALDQHWFPAISGPDGQHFAKALAKAMKLGGSQDARYLPGWIGLIAG